MNQGPIDRESRDWLVRSMGAVAGGGGADLDDVYRRAARRSRGSRIFGVVIVACLLALMIPLLQLRSSEDRGPGGALPAVAAVNCRSAGIQVDQQSVGPQNDGVHWVATNGTSDAVIFLLPGAQPRVEAGDSLTVVTPAGPGDYELSCSAASDRVARLTVVDEAHLYEELVLPCGDEAVGGGSEHPPQLAPASEDAESAAIQALRIISDAPQWSSDSELERFGYPESQSVLVALIQEGRPVIGLQLEVEGDSWILTGTLACPST